MKKKIVLIIILSLISLALYSKNDKNNLTKEQKKKLVKLVFTERPFLKAPDLKYYPETCNNFFTNEIYKVLKGNMFLGYYYDEGFKFSGKKIFLKLMKFTNDTVKIKKDYRNIFIKVFEKIGYKLDDKNSNFVLQMCVVSYTGKLTKKSYPNVVIEYMLYNKKLDKSFFRRSYSGKKEGLKYAIIDSSVNVMTSLKSFQKENDK